MTEIKTIEQAQQQNIFHTILHIRDYTAKNHNTTATPKERLQGYRNVVSTSK